LSSKSEIQLPEVLYNGGEIFRISSVLYEFFQAFVCQWQEKRGLVIGGYFVGYRRDGLNC
jgi:hypothetical protein